MSEPNIVLVRSPNLIKKNQIGYGWGNVKFSEFTDVNDLINIGFKGINRGRHTKQIKRFFNLKKGDYVVIPFPRAIAIAEVVGNKSHHSPEKGISNGENRISVNYYQHEHGVFIPRNNLSTALQSRLKIRMTVCNLNEFSEEILKHIDAVKNGSLHTWSSEQEEKQKEAEEKFKAQLLTRLRNNKNINLKAGGTGLEHLIKEILEAKGYSAHIPAKNERSGIEDADIVATRISEFSDQKEGVFIQVKHHTGTTGITGIKQISDYIVEDESDFSQIHKVLITTAEFKNDEFANDNHVTVLAGEQFVAWLYDNMDCLSNKSLLALGISNLPTLL